MPITEPVRPLFGAIEAGGTKILCAIGDAQDGPRETLRLDTALPDDNIAAICAFFTDVQGRHGPIAAIGLGTFGPVELDRQSPDWGRITTTPKPGWSGIDLRGRIERALGVPVHVDTDVNAAALAEAQVGAAKGCSSVAYITVGTGVGVGLVSAGRTVVGLGHPEVGHILPRRHPDHDGFAGICPYHGDCLEGLASGPAIIAAWGKSLAHVAPDHPAWAVQAGYIGQLCASLILTLAPEHIVIGGGVMGYDHLLVAVRRRTLHHLGGYCAIWARDGEAERRITAPACGHPSGLIGAFLLAQRG